MCQITQLSQDDDLSVLLHCYYSLLLQLSSQWPLERTDGNSEPTLVGSLRCEMLLLQTMNR